MNTLFLGFDKLSAYPDGQIVELSYQNNVLKLTLKDYKEEVATYSFLNIFQLSFENYLNEREFDLSSNSFHINNILL